MNPDPKKPRGTDGGGGGGGGGLTGMTIVMKAYDFLHGPRHIVQASAVCKRWRDLARDDAVWSYAKAEREGMVHKANAFGIAVPGGGGGAAEFGLALYKEVYSQVWGQSEWWW